MVPSMGGGSKGRTDMVVSLEKQKIKDRQQRQRQAPERLPSEYGEPPESGQPDGRPGFLLRVWRRLRG